MRRDLLLYGVIGALVGGVIVWFMASSAVNNNVTGMMQMMGMRGQTQEMMQETQEVMMGNHGDESMSMNAMVDELKGKSGDEFDKTFINLMIEHHQGAIDMASVAKTSTGHQEIKDLADNIISAQTGEIDLMRQWQKTWGY